MNAPHPRFLAFLAVATVMTAAAALRTPIEEAAILGFDLGAMAFIGLALPLWAADNAEDARARAARDDGGRHLLLLTAVAVLGAILLAPGGWLRGATI
jgi:uncharacterized membrane protein